MARGVAPGKVILLGEHAVVYGRPALAIPVRQLQAEVEVVAGPVDGPADVHLIAADIGLNEWLSRLPDHHPLARITRLTLQELGHGAATSLEVRVRSSVPIAGGLGSGAAVSVATIRALAAFFGRAIDLERQSALAYEVEKIHHGNPSGIDNSVVVYDQPVYFRRGEPPQPFRMGGPLHLVIADSGAAAPTAQAVSQVASRLRAHPLETEALFDRIGEIVENARPLLEGEAGEPLGYLMNDNQTLLASLGVSTPALERIASSARTAGAWGAKLSGAGLGGNVVALVAPESSAAVAHAMTGAGALRTIQTEVDP
ncbi:MAG: mevalonate kinase [Anaerolineales bacterium]